MTDAHSRRRKRRRAVRPSDCPDYDRTADRAPFVSAFDSADSAGSADAERAVEVNDGPADDGLRGEAFYREQIPPHY
ncbi:hypothetical protein [Corynebacterium confusum]|uniref:hypothetical protein n=1 Tax=Corynebacterium confusum TaxID=71254 RepID=UPI0025B58FFD|nr:hypothetical protein [Corynebacterium confusum]